MFHLTFEGVLPVVGAATGSLALLVAVLTYRRDAISVRVSLQRDYMVTQGDDDDCVRAELAEHRAAGTSPPTLLFISDPDKTWSFITVSNRGRRPVSIRHIGWVHGNCRKFMVPSAFMTDPDWLPATLTEGESREFPVESRYVADAVGVVAIDRTGRRFYGAYTRSWRGAVLRVMRLFRVPPHR